MYNVIKIKLITASLVLSQIGFDYSSFAHYQQAKLFPSDANELDSFGVSVAIDGNFAVIGAYQNDSNGSDSGAAYVYEFSGDAWLLRQKLTASDGATGDKFGRSVAIEGNTVVVGAYHDDNGGSVYVFTRSGTLWSQQQRIAGHDVIAGNRFGISVDIDNNTIVAGAYRNKNDRGAAYVFTRNGSIWSQQQKLTASDACNGDYFGYSVAIEANIILVGSHKANAGAGSVYVYERQDTTWSEQSILHASDANDNDYFGCSIAFDGNYAVIGAYECVINGVTDAGAAYVFAKAETGWIERQKLFDAFDPCQGDDLGRSVAIDGNTIFAGCPNHRVDSNQAGGVFEFVRIEQNWIQQDILTADDANVNDTFGASIAGFNRRIIVGSPYNHNNSQSCGSAYIFDDAPPADFDGDSDVDFRDFALLAGSWRQTDPLTDIAPTPAGDGIVDIYDLAVLCDNWLTGK
jgi:hypothetical protein